MINKHKSNKIKENSNTVRHLNNGTDHRHSKSCCDQSSPARRTINKRKYTPVNTKFKVNGATTNDGNVIANKFNTFFVNVGTVLANSIAPTDKNPVDYIQQDVINTLYFDPVTENEICKIIGSLKDSAAGWDDLKSSMIKHIKESITVPLVHSCSKVMGLFFAMSKKW